jgi:glycosyltransferase involved in cell wall biosynthesis
VRVVILTGIYPPDIGGPATHAVNLAAALRERGHGVHILTLRDGWRADSEPGLRRWGRAWPWPVRLLLIGGWLLRHRRQYDVVYATGLQVEAVAGARLARRPVVVKVVGDLTWERAREQGLTDASFDDFAGGAVGRLPASVRAVRALWQGSLRRASLVVAPSEYLAKAVGTWLDSDLRVEVVPNGVRLAEVQPRTSDGGPPLRTVFVGRLVAHKRVDVLVAAVAAADAEVVLTVVGDGTEREVLEKQVATAGATSRVRFTGSISHAAALAEVAAADVMLTASSYEGLPHTLIESLACATPIMASAAGGIDAVVRDGFNGVVVPVAAPDAFANALDTLAADRARLQRLSRQAVEDARAWSFDTSVERLEGLLSECAAVAPAADRPRLVMLGRAGITSRSPAEVAAKLAAYARHVEPVVVASGSKAPRVAGVPIVAVPSPRPRALGAGLFYVVGPMVAVARAAGRRPGAITCQSPYEAFGTVVAARLRRKTRRPTVVVEVGGDWRGATRLYGSPRRRLLAPFADAAAVWALRRADLVRAVGAFTEDLVRDVGYAGPVVRFATYTDLGHFLGPTVPIDADRPVALYIGALESTKGLDVLVRAWSDVVRRVPAARLVIVGRGSQADTLLDQVDAAGLGASVELAGRVDDLVPVLDSSTLLVLPSRSEGLGMVLREAAARARPAVGSRVGGIPEVITDGRTGLLVPAGDAPALADALVAILSDPARAAAMGTAARAALDAQGLDREYERQLAELAEWVSARGR